MSVKGSQLVLNYNFVFYVQHCYNKSSDQLLSYLHNSMQSGLWIKFQWEPCYNLLIEQVSVAVRCILEVPVLNLNTAMKYSMLRPGIALSKQWLATGQTTGVWFPAGSDQTDTGSHWASYSIK